MVFFSSGQILKKRGTPGIIEMKELGKSKVKIAPGFMLKECKALFNEWGKLNKGIVY